MLFSSIIGSRLVSHIGPGIFQFNLPRLVHFRYANILIVYW